MKKLDFIIENYGVPIWCELNAKQHSKLKSDVIWVMKKIESRIDKKTLLKYWNKVFIPLREKKMKIIEQIINNYEQKTQNSFRRV